jgi:hypothetical protein
MLIGTMEEVDAFLHTTPWGMEHTIGFYNWVLDGEPGWSVLLMSDPTDPESEGIVFSFGRGKQRAALVGCSSYRRLQQLEQETRDRPAQDLRELALMLKRYLTGAL